MKTAFVTVRDYLGKQARCTLKRAGDALTLGEAKKFAEFVKDHSDARVISYGISDSTIVDEDFDETDNGKYDRVEQKLKCLYYDADEEESLSFSLPAPRDEDVNDDQEPETDYAEDLKDLIGQVTSRERGDLLYRGGGLVSKLPKNKTSIKMTGV